MNVKLPKEQSVNKVQVGDILVFNGTAYMIIKNRNNTNRSTEDKYDLLSFSGGSYWTGNLTWQEVCYEANKAQCHYNSRDYEISIMRRSN